MRNQSRRWSQEEDKRLLRQVRAFPQNLNKCFIIVAEETGRTKSAVAGHWYNSLSKRDEIIQRDTESIWKKLSNFIKKLI